MSEKVSAMNYQERRAEIVRMLGECDECISASELAERFGVTRQVIVSDVALLRANGQRILATRRGYRMEQTPDEGELRSVLCRHRSDQVLDEFYAVVDNGGSVANVIVEHPIYGQLCADLNIASRYDAQEFVRRQQSANASQLCDLTGGLHIHMLRVPNEAVYQRIVAELDRLGILAGGDR